MLASPRLAFASGVGAAAGAALLLAGVLPGTAIALAVLALVARAGPAAAAQEPPEAARVLGRLAASAPVWAGVVVVATLRAGSPHLEDIRGAHAVAGLAVARGEGLALAAAWLAAVAAVIAVAAPFVPRAASSVAVATPDALRRLDLIAIAIQVGAVATFFAGPQVRRASDAVAWAVAVAVAGVPAVVARRAGVRMERASALALGCATLAVALALVGERL